MQWEIYATLPAPDNGQSLGYAGPVTGIQGSRLVVAGGANFPDSMPWLGGRKKYYSEAWVSDINGKKAVFEKFSLPYPVAYSANCSVPKGIVVAGGENEQGLLSKVMLINLANGRPEISFLPPLPFALTNAAAIAVGREIFVAGGETAPAATASFFKLNMADIAGGWQRLNDIPHAVSHAVLLAQDDGRGIYLFGGRKKNGTGISDLYRNVYKYTIAGNNWTEKEPLPYPLCAGTGAVINDRYIALFGGDQGAAFHQTELLINAINNEKDSVRKQQLIREKIKVQSGHPGFSKEILLYDIERNAWSTIGSIPFSAPATTTAVKAGNRIFIPSGEVRAGVRTPQILEAIINNK